MKKSIIVSIGIAIIAIVSFNFIPKSEPIAESGIKWVTFEEAIELNKKNPKKIFVDVYTNWCGWCKKMDKATFQNPEVAKYMNKNYYCIQFNAEQKEDVKFGDRVYTNTSKTHVLARELLNNKMSYPTVVFLDERFSKLSPVPGYQAPAPFLNIAKYFGDNIYKTKTWDQYNGKIAE